MCFIKTIQEDDSIRQNRKSFSMTTDNFGGSSTTTSATKPKNTAATTQSNKPTTQTAPQTTTQNTPPSVTEKELKKKGITSAAADVNDDFLRGFNEGYEEKTPTTSNTPEQTSSQVTSLSAWDDNQKSLSHKVITEITDPFLDGFNKGYEKKPKQSELPSKKGSPVSNSLGTLERGKRYSPILLEAAFKFMHGRKTLSLKPKKNCKLLMRK